MKNKLHIAAVFLLTLITISGFSQNNKRFKSLDEALVMPDSVFILDLSFANLKELPKEINRFKNLEVLDISGNQISKLPSELFGLENLNFLKLGVQKAFDGYIGNPITVLPEEILNLKKLIHLDLTGCSIDLLPEFIFKLENLDVLNIAGTKITSIPDVFFLTNYNGNFALRVDSKQNFDKETKKQLKKMSRGGFMQTGKYKILSLYK
jgi:Leucine-rich repeat (LRR) protein